MKTLNYYFWTLILVFSLQSCLEEEVPSERDVSDMTIENVVVPDEFNFSTQSEVEISLTVPEFLSHAVFSLVAYKPGVDSTVIGKATFDEAGYFSSEYAVPGYIDTILVVSNYIGFIDEVFIPVVNNQADFDYSPFYEERPSSAAARQSAPPLKSATAGGFSYMGSYDSNGVPDYLAASDIIQQNLLDDINASLPEHLPVTTSHPEYLAEGAETNIILTKPADVWITFVAEGAGWKNALGYYTYNASNPPETPGEIEDLTIIFPNASLSGSGGGLLAGDRVYLGQFPANTGIGWFLVAHGWTGASVSDDRLIHYSHPAFNAEASAEHQQHMVLLKDEVRDLLLLGFEDMSRSPGHHSDNDFNDAVFYTTVNPADAVQTENVQQIDAANDSDGDGINDELDDFPYDPDRSFNNFAPGAGSAGTLVFEDLWPDQGDYDFNDLIVDYNFNLIANAANNVFSIEATFEIGPVGGSFRNGFGFVIPVPATKIKSVGNQVRNSGYVNYAANGTEAGVDETVIFVIEDATPYENETIPVTIEFQSPVKKSDLGNPPFNPFMIVNGNRSREVHLPDFPPTSLGEDHLGSADDYSNPATGRYFKTDRNLPWALNIYNEFTPPPEKTAIDLEYPGFIPWANSGGLEKQDWYIK